MAGLLPRLALLFLLLALLVGSTAAPAAAQDCAHADTPASRAKQTQVRDAVLCLINAERAERGLNALKMSSRLRRAARDHSQDMARRGYFDHTSPSGGDMLSRAKRRGYPKGNWLLAENIAHGSGARSTPASIMRQWMRSAPHRANILSAEMRDAGVGVAFKTPDGEAGGTYTLMLGRRGR